MQFTVFKSSISHALTTVLTVVEARDDEYSQAVQLEAKDNHLYLRALSSYMGISTSIEANVEVEGKLLISGRLLRSIVNAIEGAEVSISLVDGSLEVAAGKKKMLARILPNSDFAQRAQTPPPDFGEVDAESFARAIAICSPAALVSKELSPFSGFLVRVRDGSCVVCATDGRRMMKYTIGEMEGEFEAIIPKKTAALVARLAKGQKTLTIGGDANRLSFRFGETLLRSAQLFGQFPDITKLLQVSFGTSVTLDSLALSGVANRVKVVSQAMKGSLTLVTLHIGEAHLDVSMDSQMASFSEDYPATVVGDPIAKVQFAAEFFVTPIEACLDKEITLHFVPERANALYVASSDWEYMVMPVAPQFKS